LNHPLANKSYVCGQHLSFSSAHHKASKGIFEDLLEAQELENAEIDSWVESKTSFVSESA
jgi:hypothetical protein